MSKLPSVNSGDVLRVLQRVGWYVARIKGSHHILKNSNFPERRVTIPHPKKQIKRGTVASILTQAGMSEDEFLRIL